MFKLPMDLQIKIYEYDSTYKDIFSNVLKELHKVHSFWYIKFHNQELSKDFSTDKNMTYKQALGLANYWNFDFNKNSYTISYETYYDSVKGYCDIHSRADNEPITKYFSILKASINITKFLLKKNVAF
jgi:hypothetical protein